MTDPTTPAPSVTGLLLAWEAGDAEAFDRLVDVVYQDLRRMAQKQLRSEREGHTLQPTALLHEAYLRLVDQKQAKWQNRAQFFAIAARQMRRILVDYARKRQTGKRGGEAPHVELDEALALAAGGDFDTVALDDALERFAALAPRQAQVVELRFFGGLTVEETAAVLEISPATAKLDWNLARAWLFRELGSTPTS